MKVLFLCDIDNTILFSARHRKAGDVCVEYLEGREQGFITGREEALAADLKGRVLFSLITTRSIEQTLRIRWPFSMRPDLAVAANGGHLLLEGETDRGWREEAEREILPVREELDALLHLLSRHPDYLRAKIVDDTYLFGRLREGASPAGAVEDLRRETDLEAAFTGQKIYVFPPGISKGRAAEKLKKRLAPDLVLAAGDSPIDDPMLQAADISLVPDRARGEESGARHFLCPGKEERFPDFVFRKALQILAELS